jgi:amidase
VGGTAEVRWAGLVEQVSLLAAGEVSSLGLVRAALERASATRRSLNAFALLREVAALDEAREADRCRRAGDRRPLLGVPVAVKDDTDLVGTPTSFGCPGQVSTPGADAEITRRLREAGAVIIGKTTTPELGQWPFTESQAFGSTRNPWSLAHSPGGSSGGSAVAVSAGIVPAATGSDGAGSVRIPAAWTGLVGVKPTRGRVSSWPDPDAFHGLTTHGVLARTVADAALLLDVISGSHPGDRYRLPPSPETFVAAARPPQRRLRVALSLAIPYSGVSSRLDPEIEAAVRRLGSSLAGAGHEVVEVDPHYGLVGASFMPRSHAGLNEWRSRLDAPELVDGRTRRSWAYGALARGPLLRLALASEGWFARRLGSLWQDADVLLTPTTATPPLLVGACEGRSHAATDGIIASACPYAWPWNVVGWPALNVPAGLTCAGLPVGAQLVGPAGSEALLLGVAAELERVERWYLRRPPFEAREDQEP